MSLPANCAALVQRFRPYFKFSSDPGHGSEKVRPVAWEWFVSRSKLSQGGQSVLTQQQLADLVGVSKHTLHNLETGKKATFYQNVVALANALGFDMKLIRKGTTP